MYLSVIIPAYKEENVITSTLKSIDAYLKRQSYDYEILVIIDGIKDRTGEVVKSLEPEIKGLRAVVNQENHGKGYAVKQGMLEAKGDFRVFTDADNSTSIDHLDKFFPYTNQGYQVVIGSIAISGHKISSGSEPLWRRIFGKLGNLFIQIMAVPGIYDTQRGFKLVTAKAAETIFPKLTIERWGFDVEMLAIALKYKFKIKELPVDWHNNPNSHVGLEAYKEVLFDTIKIRWGLMTGKYS